VDQSTQPVETADAYSQIRDEILAKLDQKGPTEFKMQLQPENLGQIDISLKISEGKLIIDILADKSQTQALLISQVDKLVSSLGLQNAHVESVQVSQQMNSDSQNSQNQGYQMSSGMDFSQGRQNSGETGESWRQISNGIFGTQTDFTAAEAAKGTEQSRNNFGRMNYVI
jgi:flagellar hook-length control protein FliK